MRRKPGAHVLAVVVLLAACSSSPTPAPSLASSAPSTQRGPAATATPRTPPPSGPTRTAPPATGVADFTTSAPVDPDTAWATIAWHKLGANDPLADLSSVIRWPGGFAAVSAMEVAEGQITTPLWLSVDGTSWYRQPADLFGPGSVVVGLSRAQGGLAAQTLLSGGVTCEEPSCWSLSGPLTSWTSPDGATWTSFPGPDLDLGEMTGEPDKLPVLVGETSEDDLIIARGGLPLAASQDGIVWDKVRPAAFQPGWTPQDVSVQPGNFIGIGSIPDKAALTVITSRDGKTWVNQDLAIPHPRSARLALGSSQFVMVMAMQSKPEGDTTTEEWWWSSNGANWSNAFGFEPLGFMRGPEAGACRNECADGVVLGNGERFIAYRGWGDQAGWTSFQGAASDPELGIERDGWTALEFDGRPERPSRPQDDTCTHSLAITLLGVSCTASDGARWFGTPD